MAIKDRLIQFVFRGKEELSPEAKKAKAALEKVRKESAELAAQLDKSRDAQGLADALQRTRAAAERGQSTLERAEKKAAELRKELNEKPDSRGLAESLRAAEREAARAARELDRLTASTKAAEAAAAAAGFDTRNLAAEQKRLREETDKAKRATHEKGKQLQALEREYRRAARASAEHKSRVDAARESMTRGAKQVIGLATAYLSLRSAMRLVQGGLNLIRDGIRSMLTAGSDAEQAIAQLDAVLMSTGHAAGFTAKQLRDMAKELRDSSMFDEEQILAAQTRLLSYTDVVGEQFPAAMQIVIDQAQRLGMSVEQSAELVGQALQSPSKAMTALGRQGFTLEESQKKLLKQFEETGEMAQAQAIIMDMLTESYGGSAAAARFGTAKGLWKGLRDTISDFYERVSNAGAMDAVQDRLRGLAEQIDQMEADGTLENLAEALSGAFVQGIEKIEEFARELGAVDFKQVANDSTAWLRDFGEKIDGVRMRIQLFFAPFRTLFNGLTSGIASVVAWQTKQLDMLVAGIEYVARILPDAFGGARLRQRLGEVRGMLQAVTKGAVDQIRQDGKDIAAAWDTTWRHADKGPKKAAEATRDAGKAQKELARETSAASVQIEAGTRALEDFAAVQAAISEAGTDVDLRALRTEIVKLYQSGKLSVDEYNKAIAALTKRQQELRDSTRDHAEALRDQAAAANQSAEALAGQAEETDAARSAMGAFVDAVLTRARTALADLSAKALAAYDALRGINSVDIELDTSTVDGLRRALDQLERSIGNTQRSLANPEMNKFNRWAHETIQSSQQVQKETVQQKLRLEELMERYESGVITLANFRSQAQGLKTSLDLLDDTDLSKLDSALASVEQRMKSVGDSARSSLDSLRDELDRLRGDEEAIERRRMVSRQQELQAQLAEARAAGNAQAIRELQQGLAVLNTIRSEQAKARVEAERQNRRGPGAPAGPAGSPAPAAQAPTTVIRLESPRGSAVDVSVAPGQEDALLSLLEQAGMRTIS